MHIKEMIELNHKIKRLLKQKRDKTQKKMKQNEKLDSHKQYF